MSVANVQPQRKLITGWLPRFYNLICRIRDCQQPKLSKNSRDIPLNLPWIWRGQGTRYWLGSERVSRAPADRAGYLWWYAFQAVPVGTVAARTAYGFIKATSATTEILPDCRVERLAQGAAGVKRTTGQHQAESLLSNLYGCLWLYTGPISSWRCDGRVADYYPPWYRWKNVLKLDVLGHDDPTMIRKLPGLVWVLILLIFLWIVKVSWPLFSGADILGVTQEMVRRLVCKNSGVRDQLRTGHGWWDPSDDLCRALQLSALSWVRMFGFRGMLRTWSKNGDCDLCDIG